MSVQHPHTHPDPPLPEPFSNPPARLFSQPDQAARDELSRNAGASDSVAASTSAQIEVIEKQRAALQQAKEAAEAEAERLSAQLIQAQSGARALEAEAARLRCARNSTTHPDKGCHTGSSSQLRREPVNGSR